MLPRQSRSRMGEPVVSICVLPVSRKRVILLSFDFKNAPSYFLSSLTSLHSYVTRFVLIKINNYQMFLWLAMQEVPVKYLNAVYISFKAFINPLPPK